MCCTSNLTLFEKRLVEAFCRTCPCAAHSSLMTDMRAGGRFCRESDAFYAACGEIRHSWASCPLNGNVDLGWCSDAVGIKASCRAEVAGA